MGNSQHSISESASADAIIVQQDPNLLSIEGRVDFSTVPKLFQQAQNYIKTAHGKPLVFDYSNVNSSNSAALVLMLEIVKQGKLAELNLQFKNLPDSVLQIAKAYGVETEIRALFI